jgi:hypothetical protein
MVVVCEQMAKSNQLSPVDATVAGFEFLSKRIGSLANDFQQSFSCALGNFVRKKVV